MMAFLGVALIASAVYLMAERKKKKDAEENVSKKRTLLRVLEAGPQDDAYKKELMDDRDAVKKNYKRILASISEWNDYSIEALSIDDIVRICSEDIGYDVGRKAVEKWIEKKKLKAFKSPRYNKKTKEGMYVFRTDFQKFIDDAKEDKLIGVVPEGFVEKLIGAKTIHIIKAPGIVLSEMQTVQSNLVKHAKKKHVILGKPAEAITFTDNIGKGKEEPPKPTDDLIAIQKQLSAVRDIMYLLMESEVIEIRDITKNLGEKSVMKTEFFSAQEFEVSFVATYPSIARFLKMLLEPKKRPVQVDGSDAPERLPRNLFVVSDIMYESHEIEQEKKMSQWYREKEKIEKERMRREKEEGLRMRRDGRTGTTGTGRSHYGAGGSGYGADRSGYGMSVVTGTRLPPRPNFMDDEEYRRWQDKMNERDGDITVGRRPQHNILKVTMKIWFVDLRGEVTGENPKKRRGVRLGIR